MALGLEVVKERQGSPPPTHRGTRVVGRGKGGARVHVIFTAKSFGNTPGLATGVVLKKSMSFLQPSHLETH